MQAVGVLMNKLLRILWALMRNRTFYDSDFQRADQVVIIQRRTFIVWFAGPFARRRGDAVPVPLGAHSDLVVKRGAPAAWRTSDEVC